MKYQGYQHYAGIYRGQRHPHLVEPLCRVRGRESEKRVLRFGSANLIEIDPYPMPHATLHVKGHVQGDLVSFRSFWLHCNECQLPIGALLCWGRSPMCLTPLSWLLLLGFGSVLRFLFPGREYRKQSSLNCLESGPIIH